MFGGRRLLINSRQLFFQRPRQNYWLIPNIKSHDLTVSKRTLSNPYVNKAFIISSPSFQNFVKCNTTYSSFYNLIAAISRVLIDQHLIFCSPTCSTCCNSSRKCMPVKYKTRQKVRYPSFTQTTSQ